jgi:hypothetical protein
MRGGLCVLKVAQKECIVGLSKKEKLEPRFMGTFEVR